VKTENKKSRKKGGTTMNKMIALLVLGTSIALAGTPAFARESGETPESTQVVAAQATDSPVTMGLGNSSVDPRPSFVLESHPQ
jgi:hypothetical protein